MDIRHDTHAETSSVRTQKTPTGISQVRIQKTSAETFMDIRQNIHAVRRHLIVRTEKTPTDTSQVRKQKTSAETSVDIRQNIHVETF
jgi:hypothetical protein